MPKRSADDFDDEDTDELPVLLDTVGLEDAVEPPFEGSRPDDTANRPGPYATVADAPGSPESAPAELDMQVAALETQIRVLTDGTRDLEQQLAEKNRRIDELGEALASLRRSTDDSTAAEKHLATQLAIRDARIAELTATVERLQQAAADAAAEGERLRALAESRSADVEALRQELETKPPPESAPPGDDFREDYATLRSYVAARRAWWDEMQTTNARLAARVTALEDELAASSKGLAAAEAFAARESSRAVGLRAELVDYGRRVDELERELRLFRTPEPEPQASAEVVSAAPVDTANAPTSRPHGGAQDPSPPDAPVPIDVADAMSSAVEAIAQLEAEVEYKRQQVAAQLVELRDRELQLRTATGELGELRSELDESRSNVERLERTVADMDRALEARDTRIATLQEELKERAERRGAARLSQSAQHAAEARPSGSYVDGADDVSAPVLICLTGDAPKQFALTKKTVTVGRGPQCDLQIVTHFVSREHARLTVSADATLIEDLGSRNGVFVNSVRVDRRQLQQGDLVTIGETQFRFVESMAH
jgi:pSer/pThr/pTyr-binding forkhead associated (FHA) protein